MLFCLWSVACFSQTPSSVRFVRNQGQWDTDIRYAAEIPNGYLVLKEKSLMYVFYDENDLRSRHATGGTAHNARASAELHGHAVEVLFEEANSAIQIEENHKNPVEYNYFIGSDPRRWAAHVPTFGEVIYHDIYPGIDFKMYAFRQTLKYEFVVKPNADASRIKMRYMGAENIKISDNQLVVQTSVNHFKEQKPYTYQEIHDKTQEVSAQFKLDNSRLSFEFPKGYNTAHTLTIDPELVFSTFSGSLANNFGHAATYDEQGNLYTAGTTHSLGSFPTTAGAFQRLAGSILDVAILKFNPDGTRLLYGTYLGGNQTETPHSMIVDNKGELVVFGSTSSVNFPITNGAFQSRLAGGSLVEPIGGFQYVNGSDIFISKLSNDGTRLQASTFVGGNGNDGVSSAIGAFGLINYSDEFRGEVVVDAQDNVYVATSTSSSNFPTVNGINNTTRGQDAVVFKLNPSLSTMLMGTYLGGIGNDAAYGIKWASSGAVYVTGVTRSANMPTRTGSFKNILSGAEDGFVAKFINDRFEQLTYLGTDSLDVAYLVDVDAEENVHVFGLTRGRYPTTQGTYGTAGAGQFIHALDKTLSRTVFAATFGSSRSRPDIAPTAFLVNECGNIYLSGWGGIVNTRNGYNPFSNTTGLPTTSDAIRTTTTGSNFYIAILEKQAKSLLYATFIGSTTSSADGDHVDGGTSRFSKSGVIYQATCVCRAANFPTTPNVWAVNRGNPDCNNAAFKFDIDKLVANFDTYEGSQKGVLSGCVPLTLDFVNTSENGKTFTWDVQGNNISRDPLKATYTFNQPGEYRVTLRAFNPLVCRGQDVVTKIIKVGVSKARAIGDTTVCSNVPVQLRAEGGFRYVWTPTAGLSNANISNPVASVNTTTQFNVRVTDSTCTVTRSVTVRISNEKADFVALRDTTICAGQSAILTARGAATRFRWTPANSLSDTVGTRIVARPTQTTTYTVVGVYADGCRPQKTITVRVDDSKPDFRVSPDTTVCVGQSAQLLAQGGTTLFRWTPHPTLSDTTIRNPMARPTQTTTYTVTALYPDGCKPRKAVTVSVERGPQNVNFDVVANYACGQPTALQYVNRTAGAARYEWDFGNGTRGQMASPSLTYTQTGNYSVSLRAFSAKGCETIVTKPVIVTNLDRIPNVITPNGDGKNDTFVLGVAGLKVEIFNRWGKRIFQSDSYTDDWGKDVINGTYYYLLTFPNDIQCKGWIQVLQ